MMNKRKAEMATGIGRKLRMFRRSLALIACAAIGGAPLSFGQTLKFEGVYKGTIVLTSATAGFSLNPDCNPSTNKFEQIMTVSGDRFYLERKASQQNNMVVTGTVAPDGTASGSGLTPRSDNTSVYIMNMLTGKIENDQFTGSITSRYCSYSVKMKK